MAATLADVPPHVPKELCWDHDIDVYPAQFDDPYVGACNALHAGPDIVWAARGAYCGRPGWLLTRFEHLQEVQMDPGRFAASLSRDASSLLGFDLPLIPFESDPPQHKTYRQLIQPWFQPSAVGALEPMLRDICRELIARFEDRGSCEFVSEFSSLFPSYVFLGLMGLPREMLPQFLAWENGFLRGDSMETRAGAIRAIYDYFRELLAEHRARPQDNLMSLVATGETDGRRLTDDEAIGMCITLYIGGLDSVASGLGWYMRHLALDRDLQQRLRNDPGLIRPAVDELSRAYGTNSTIRTVTRDTEFHGVPMRAGRYRRHADVPEFQGPARIRRPPCGRHRSQCAKHDIWNRPAQLRGHPPCQAGSHARDFRIPVPLRKYPHPRRRTGELDDPDDLGRQEAAIAVGLGRGTARSINQSGH